MTSPHDGELMLTSIPERMNGCKDSGGNRKGCVFQREASCETPKCKITTAWDRKTVEMVESAANEIQKQTGKRPYVIVSNINRKYLDQNRDILEGAQGNEVAVKAYEDFHGAILDAQQEIKTGLLVDFHRQTHPDNEIELGYLISRTDLMNGNFNIMDTGFASLARRNENLDFLTFASDENSLGKLVQKHGKPMKNWCWNADDKQCNPVPFETNDKNGFKMGSKYFNGGFITTCHGSRYSTADDSVQVDAVQIEFPKKVGYLKTMGKATGRAIVDFVNHYYP